MTTPKRSEPTGRCLLCDGRARWLGIFTPTESFRARVGGRTSIPYALCMACYLLADRTALVEARLVANANQA